MLSLFCFLRRGALLLCLCILFQAIGLTQIMLIQTSDTVKINAALAIVKKYEPVIFEQVITKAHIQFGELPYSKDLNFAISNSEANGKTRHWIMLTPRLMNGHSVDIVACILVHEAMHLGFNMGLFSSNYLGGEQSKEDEHVTIYNYELKFLKKIGASTRDIISRKEIMKQLSIPIKNF